MDLLALRLLKQHLLGGKINKPENAVGYFGAMQAQDYGAAKWSLGLRLSSALDNTIEKALTEGRILRTHILRPTWHFVVPEDIRDFLTLTAPRIKKLMSYYDRKLGLTDNVLKNTNAIITKALYNTSSLTRQEIKQILEQNGIQTDGQRLGHIVFHAEVDAIIASGPKRGKQLTYALLEKRVPSAKSFDREKVLARLAEKYFTSHGPAQVKDFAWWSGLSSKDAVEGLSMIQSKLESMTTNGKTYWLSRDASTNHLDVKSVFLLSVYDEYFISYADRSDMVDERYKENLPIGNALLTSLIIIDGKVAGTWKKHLDKNTIKVKLFPFENLSRANEHTIETIVKTYGNFFRLPAEVAK